jgi:RNA polymerase-binding transcription factor DksA
MNTQQEHHEKLNALLTKVTAELELIAILNSETGDWEARGDASEQPETDENSEADAVEELEVRTATVLELENSYRNIVRALQKLSLGTYGTCEICNETISSERLGVLPSARTCTEHKDEERTLPL